MYSNLVKDNLLDEGTEVVVSLGIGRGSSQWMQALPDGTFKLTGLKAGMNKLEELRTLGDAVVHELTSTDKLHSLVSVMSTCARPVIALKSGAALFLDNKDNAGLRKVLTQSPPESKDPEFAGLVEENQHLKSELESLQRQVTALTMKVANYETLHETNVHCNTSSTISTCQE